jgi:hypothetical protein
MKLKEIELVCNYEGGLAWPSNSKPIIKCREKILFREVSLNREAAIQKLVEALEFASMPITTPKEQLTIDRLLATIAEDVAKIKEALKTWNKLKE